MNKIITISRQFGSGGREVGKRLADKLGYAYYDKEIIDKVSNMSGLDPDYINKFSESGFSRFYSYTFARSFHSYNQSPSTKIWIAQNKALRQLAEKGPCIIVGRCADYVLKEEKPFKIFIYSSEMNSRIERCYKKVPSDRERFSKDIEKEINRIDKERSKYYNHYTGQVWGEMNNYNLCIDTSKVGIKNAVEIIASLFLSIGVTEDVDRVVPYSCHISVSELIMKQGTEVFKHTCSNTLFHITLIICSLKM